MPMHEAGALRQLQSLPQEAKIAMTDTAWWHEWVQGKGEVRFVRGRLRFGGMKDNAPFPSAVVIYRRANA